MPVGVSSNTHIVLNDKTFLYNKDAVEDYLVSLGFDLDSLTQVLCGDIEAECNYYKDTVDYTELKADNYYCAARDLAQGIDDLCDDFRKKYKSQAIMKVLDTIQKFVYENRID